MSLTTGAVRAIYSEYQNSPLYSNSTVQVLNIKAVTVPGGIRYSATIPDGINFMQAMLGRQCSPLVDSEQIKHQSIISLGEFNCSQYESSKLLTVLSFNVVQINVETMIGAPSHFIRDLDPYRASWRIKARVTQKSEIKKFNNNSNAKGQLFNVNLSDPSGEIMATILTHEVSRFYHLLEEGNEYYISDARVALVTEDRRQYSALSSQYELFFNKTKARAVNLYQGSLPM